MPPRILGIHGKKGSGKTTLARLLQQEYGWSKTRLRSLAAPIKEICIDVLGLDHDSVYGTEAEKNRPTHIKWGKLPDWDPAWDWENHPPELTDKLMTGRQVMQEFGTRVFRHMDEDVWLKCLLRRVSRQDGAYDLVVVDDVRFPNEVEGIQAAGGKVIKLARRLDDRDLHVSETALDGHAGFDAIVNNASLTPVETLAEVVAALTLWWGAPAPSPEYQMIVEGD